MPKNFSFGQGVSRGFSRTTDPAAAGGGGGKKKGKKKKNKHWHQQETGEDTTRNIEDVQLMDLADALVDQDR